MPKPMVPIAEVPLIGRPSHRATRQTSHDHERAGRERRLIRARHDRRDTIVKTTRSSSEAGG
jgi:hypothetical protein